MKTKITYLLLILVAVFYAGNLYAQILDQSFGEGNIVVLRLGEGSASITSDTQPVFLDEYSTDGNFIQTVAFPTTGADRFVISGNASQGFTSLSPNGGFVAAIAYDAELLTPYNDVRTPYFDKKIAIISYNKITYVPIGAIDLIDPRAAVTTDGQDIWFGGQKEGIRYIKSGDSESVRLTGELLGSVRSMNISNGQLYVSTSNTTGYITQVGDETPKSLVDTTYALIPGEAPLNLPYLAHGFVFFDVNPSVEGDDLLYVNCDQQTGFLRKYTFNGTNWTEIAPASSGSLFKNAGLTGSIVDGKPVLYATQSSGSGIVKIVDNAGPNQSLNATASVIVNAKPHTVFRGITFTPKEIKTSSVNNLRYDALDFTLVNGKVRFMSEKNEKISIYNIAGQQIVSTQTIDGANEIDIPSKGIFIVRVGNKVSKLINK